MPYRVDAGICTHHDEILDHFAPDTTKWPVGEHVVPGSEGHAKDYEQQIGDGKIYDEQIGGGTHLRIAFDHNNH